MRQRTLEDVLEETSPDDADLELALRGLRKAKYDPDENRYEDGAFETEADGRRLLVVRR